MARMLFLRDIDVDVQLRCRACGHGGVLPRSILERRFGPNYPVLSIAPHYRCSRCEGRDTESRPAVRDRFVRDAAPPDEPSFDAPLAALQGLLASVRGSDKPAGKATAPPPPWSGPDDPDDSLPAFKPFTGPKPAVAAAVPAMIDLADTDLADTDWDEPLPAWTPPVAGKSVRDLAARDLEELAADGPADADAQPLWEPVSLADMASRLEGHREAGWEDTGGAADGPDEPDEAAVGVREEPLDETLAAMRRFFADADLEEDAGRPVAPMPAPMDAAPADAFNEAEDDDSGLPPVFSHKVFARTDFDDLDEDLVEVDAFGGDAGWAGAGEDEETGEEEPTDEDILAFAIRDPERPAAQSPTPSPAPPPLPLSKAERVVKPVPANDGDGFDRTLAALRSMIEDAATEPKPVPIRRKTRPSADPPASLGDPQEAGPADAGSVGPDAVDPDEAPVVKIPAKTGRAAKAAGTPKRSAQEREIEEAMKALRDLVEDEDPFSAEPEAGARPSFGRAANSFEEPPAERPPEMPAPSAPPPGKKRAEGDGDASPLSKTIAALRGMLELDGRRKR